MPSLAIAQSEHFARLFFHEIETLAEAGTWIPASEAFMRTVDRHAGHPYARSIEARPARRIGFTAVSERIRKAEFAHIERRKTGAWRSAPVFFRVRAESRALVPLAPREVVGVAAATQPGAPDLGLLDRALAQRHDADASAAALSQAGGRSLFERACEGFDWHQPIWPERLMAMVRRLLAQISALWSKRLGASSTAA